MSSRRRAPTDRRDILDRLVQAGCTIERTGSTHLRVTGPDGSRITASASPSDWRSSRLLVRDARVYLGVDLRRGTD